jgi:hypothetical protein
MGLNDARELSFEKEMWWQDVSSVYWASVLKAQFHLNLKGSEHRTIITRFDTDLKNLKNYKFSGESCDEGLKKISTENLKRGEEKTFRVSVVEKRKTFKFGRFSRGRHWEQVRMTGERSIARRKCIGKVSPMSVEPWIRLRTCICSVRRDRRRKVFSSPLSVEIFFKPSSHTFLENLEILRFISLCQI